LKVNNAELECEEIMLGSNQTRWVYFQVRRDEPGEYEVAINDKSTRFVVAASPPPVTLLAVTPAAPPVPEPAPPAENIPASPTTPAPGTSLLPEKNVQTSLNWTMPGLIALFGVAILVALCVILIRRKPGRP